MERVNQEEERQQRRNEARPGLSPFQTIRETALDFGRRGEARFGPIGKVLGTGAGAVVGIGKAVAGLFSNLF